MANSKSDQPELEPQSVQKDEKQASGDGNSKSKKPSAVAVEKWISRKEKESGRIPAKVKEVFRIRCRTRTDYDQVWKELWS